MHPHVHGAHLGVRGSAYLACGGFPALPVSEDVALVRALEQCRRDDPADAGEPGADVGPAGARARGGFGDDIDRLASDLSGR